MASILIVDDQPHLRELLSDEDRLGALSKDDQSHHEFYIEATRTSYRKKKREVFIFEKSCHALSVTECVPKS